MEVSEKLSSLANYPAFQQRTFSLFVVKSEDDAVSKEMKQYVFGGAVGNYATYNMVAWDPSVRLIVVEIDPWDPTEANAVVTDGMLTAAVNAVWNTIVTEIYPPAPPEQRV